MLLWAVLALVRGNTGDAQPLHIDIEWILQGKSLGFSGFFCEFLGLSSGLREIFPHMRFTKSRARMALVEPLVGFPESSMDEGNDMTSDFFMNQLIEKEGEDTRWLSHHTQNTSVDMKNSLKSKFFPEFAPKVNESCLSTTAVHEGVAFSGGELARAFVPEAHVGPEECCKACQENPLCVSWTHAPYAMGPLGVVIGEAGEHEYKCILRGGNPLRTSSRTGAMSGEMVHGDGTSSASVNTDGGASDVALTGARRRMTVPRAIVFHGTMCVHNNETVYQKEIKRDINTIRIGRFMIERKDLRGEGMTQDEFSVMSCFSHMDRVWVPTQWHKDAFIMMLRGAFGDSGTANSVKIDIIPESVDTDTFDPTKIRTAEEGNLFHIRSREPADLCTVTPSEAGGERAAVTCSSVSSRFEFLSIFKWEYRKGWDLLLEAYWNTFDKDDSVVLRLRTYMPPWEHEKDINITHHAEAFARQTMGVHSLDELAPVVWETGKNSALLSDSLTRPDVRDLLGSADCFVLPTRGEGWGLPIAEAMAMRVPTIVSQCPGPRAYATNDNAYLIPPEENNPESVDHRGYFKPDKRALGTLMREVIRDSGPQGGSKALIKTAKAREDMAALSPLKVAAMMAKSLRDEVDVRGWSM